MTIDQGETIGYFRAVRMRLLQIEETAAAYLLSAEKP